VEVVEYGDYQCPFSRLAFRIVEQLEHELAEDLRFVYRHFPQPEKGRKGHPFAPGAARFVEAAARQDRFWDAHELVFHRQKALDPASRIRYASSLGLDVDRIRSDERGEQVGERVARDIASALANGLTGTPSVFVNGERYHGDSVWKQLAPVVLGARNKRPNH
jgi:protein-disulfide isomerase